jgi:hypothetical protein
MRTVEAGVDLSRAKHIFLALELELELELKFWRLEYYSTLSASQK